jgi:hypothetical protein
MSNKSKAQLDAELAAIDSKIDSLITKAEWTEMDAAIVDGLLKQKLNCQLAAEAEAKQAAEAEAKQAAIEAEWAAIEAELAAIAAKQAALEAELAAIAAKEAAESAAVIQELSDAELANHKAAFLNLKERQALINVGRKRVTEDGELIGEYNLYPKEHSEFCLGVVRLQLLAATATKLSAVNTSFQLQRPAEVKLRYSNATWRAGEELFKEVSHLTTSESTMWENEDDLNVLDLGEVQTAIVVGEHLTTIPYNWKEYPLTNGVITQEGPAWLAIHPYTSEEMMAFPEYRKNVDKVVTKVNNDCYKVFGENQEFVLTIVGTVNYSTFTNTYVGTFSVFGKAV